MSEVLRLVFVEARIYGLTLVAGVLLILQGWGSGVTELLRGAGWGPLAWVAERVALPEDAPFLLGALGFVLVLSACFAVQHD
ncbi:hypothetical protein ACIRPH_08780 [Nocardiopsis sp. NPDC101807]|uniref:hypothetical protein n=1 Tax=Nocardiopsis sp. NPDC101807 TaxID=3364339 RepID=UPI003812A73F